MKTALQQAIELLKKEQLENAKDHTTYQPYQRAINICISLLPTEREQIEDAITDIAPQLCFILEGDARELAQDYFTSKYGNNG